LITDLNLHRKERLEVMLKKRIMSFVLFSFASLSGTAFAGDECKSDGDCKDGKFCIVAVTPHVCKPPQPAGAACKRDVVCASKKCDIPAGKDSGVCSKAK